MKKLLCFSLFIFQFSLGYSQTWLPVGGGIYGSDSVTYSGQNPHLPILALCVYNNKLYAGGAFYKAGNKTAHNIACWDGKKWDTLRNGTSGRVTSLAVYTGGLYVGGTFIYAGRKKVNCIALWQDSNNVTPQWYAVYKGIDKVMYMNPTTDDKSWKNEDMGITSIYPYKKDLYVCGYFDGIGNLSVSNIAKLHAIEGWQALGKPTHLILNNTKANFPAGIINGARHAMAVFQGKLYLGGWDMHITYNNGEGHQHLETWNDSIFNPLPDKDFKQGPSGISCVLVDDTDLFVAGGFHTDDKTNGIAVYNGKQWSYPISTVGNGEIRAMVMYKNKLYVAGQFDSINGIPYHCIAAWNGNNWENVGDGFTSNTKLRATINSLCIYKGELYAAGFFTSSGGKPVLNIAKLSLNTIEVKKKK